MKKLFIVLTALGFGAFCLPLRALDLGVSWAVYATPAKPYIEVNLEIAALSVLWLPVDGDSARLQASAEITILILAGEEVVNYQKYALLSPVTAEPQSLLDARRLALPEGDYTLEITANDLNKPDNRRAYKTPVSVKIGPGIHLSETQFLRGFYPDTTRSPFWKNGYFMEPLPFDFYDRFATRLAFYNEIYFADQTLPKGASYLVRYFVELEKGNNERSLISMGNQRKKAGEIDALLIQMDISRLESGNYRLTVELRDEDNNLLALRSKPFQRSNPFLRISDEDITEESLSVQFVQKIDEKDLVFTMRALTSTVFGSDLDMAFAILQEKDPKAMRFYIFRHFAREEPSNPERAWKDFIQLAKAVDDKFHSGFRYGFETDRGRTFLRYGKPDDLIRVEDDPGAPPYEIWVYYNFPKTKQKNVKFLFYNPTLAGEDFIVLHSTARGEVSNPRWEIELYRRSAGEQYEGNNYNDATRMRRNFNRQARVYFEDF